MTARECAVLSEYEVGRAITAVEWVARAGKPIVEVGSRLLGPWELHHLAEDMALCLAVAGEPAARAFIVLGSDGWWRFGFYRHPWAIAAFVYLQQRRPHIQGAHARTRTKRAKRQRRIDTTVKDGDRDVVPRRHGCVRGCTTFAMLTPRSDTPGRRPRSFRGRSR
jgi:hypothetical protein